MRIVFDTWQFVRVMVRLEQTRDRDAARRALWAAWAADWRKVDRELERLRNEDFARFADAMMAQEVIFDPVDAATARAVARLAREVAGELDRAQQGGDPAARQDLAFERAGLADLAERFEGLARAASARRASDRPASTRRRGRPNPD